VRSARRRRTIEITVPRPGEVLVAAPTFSSPERLRALVLRRADWIVRHGGAGRPERIRRFEDGETLPYLGHDLPLRFTAMLDRRITVREHHGALEIAAPSSLDGAPGAARRDAIVAALERWYGERAAEVLAARVAALAPLLDVEPSGVLVRDQRRRWGSCSRSGVLRFNWRIVMAAPALIDYLVIHELTHLRVRSHGRDYWAQVARVLPDYRERRERLRTAGVAFEL